MNDLKSIKFRVPNESSPILAKIEPSDSNPVLSSFVSYLNWMSLTILSDAIKNKSGFSSNDHGFRFPSDAEEWEEKVDGVQIFSPIGEEVYPESEFHSFMAKYLNFILDKYDSVGLKKLGSDWEIFKSNAKSL